jgi:hypothetical protein
MTWFMTSCWPLQYYSIFQVQVTRSTFKIEDIEEGPCILSKTTCILRNHSLQEKGLAQQKSYRIDIDDCY